MEEIMSGKKERYKLKKKIKNPDLTFFQLRNYQHGGIKLIV